MKVRKDEVILTDREYHIMTFLAESAQADLPPDSTRHQALSAALEYPVQRSDEGWVVNLRTAHNLHTNMHQVVDEFEGRE